MTDHHRDLSFSNLSSIDSYSNVFDKAKHNFTNSSEISFITNTDDEQFVSENNRTFTKEKPKTIINVFTGKPISPNPWRKLCTKSVHHHAKEDPILSVNKDILTNHTSVSSTISNKKAGTRQSRIDTIINQRITDSSDEDDIDQAFDQPSDDHQDPIDVKSEANTPILRARKARVRAQHFIESSSTSSDECVREDTLDIDSKHNESVDNTSSWRKLEDIYTSEESDEKKRLETSVSNYTIRLKSEIYTSDQSTGSSSSSSSSLESIDNCLSNKQDNAKISYNFLESLSESIPIDDKHPDAKTYFIRFGFKLKEKRQELAEKLLSIFNHDVFSSQLSDKVSVAWSGRLTATAGHCTTRRMTRTAVITLSHKVCDTPERCRDTLLHEMCHAAVTLIDGVMEHGHGPLWRQWTRMAERCYPSLPLISIRHTYDITYKFIYRCVQCRNQVYRHSRSLNLEVDCCGKCFGKFELTENNIKQEIKLERQTPKKPMNKYNQYVKENFQIMKQTNPHLSTPQIMKRLSEEYKKVKQENDVLNLPAIDQLKI